ncbi:MAG: Flp pilus assembly complex ATPase component TadA [Bdellovibrionales bacterium]|nr:Flp pilus assembly complex ATPase component TadA [Bdellovibrionales bacterium]MBT3526095.1 Flp pilus assembly complex ATPase component TadA [Bdellovibrionales bacterium]MBT7668219.1 Flp pilus assembly complex ATPase component TadA [Bdellovibrionales bacterium]
MAVFDPSINDCKGELLTLLQSSVKIVVISLSDWASLYETVRESVDELADTVKELKTKDEDEGGTTIIGEDDISDEVCSYVNHILAESYAKGASDIHIEPYETNVRVRYRIDGTLIEAIAPSPQMALPLISRVKIMSDLDIAEKRKPQDGRMKLQIGGKAVDYRVSTMPTLFGEKVVMRILDSSNLMLDMIKLGFDEKQLTVFKEGINRPFGMCLVTGPTGSGKTTTLYSALSELNDVGRNISTAEDPVEFNFNGINQVHVKPKIGFGFPMALKAFLRQDPDIIMVGEIRDQDTAEIAVEAALTGHLVLSTLHTNDAPSTITRLINMGVEAYLVVGALNVIVAQRLCRRICKGCIEHDQSITVDELVACGIKAESAARLKVYKGRGCDACTGTGYRGRVAIYEVMELTPRLKQLVLKGAASDELKRMAMAEGMSTLRRSALVKVAQGMTTLDEAISNSSHDKK